MKSLTCKQAERWLEKVKESNSGAYREIGKLLRRYDKTNDESEVFKKMNEILLSLPQLTEQFNVYLEQGTRMIVNPRNQVKINEFVKFVRKHRGEMLEDIIKMVSRLSNQYQNWSDMPQLDQGRLLKDNLHQIVKDDPQLKAYFEQTFIFEPNQILSKLKLDHLQVTNKHQKIEEDVNIQDISQPQKKIKKDPPPRKEEPKQLKQPSKPKLVFAPYMMNVNEEKMVFKNLEKKISPAHYEDFIKILYLYHLTVITKNQAFEFLSSLPAEDFEYIKDVFESREVDRRRYSIFRPLPDGDFHLLERSTHSYVRMPQTYPNICSQRQKNEIARENLNRVWISVPRGTEESFNIRMKNYFQANLIKCQDQMYEYDIFKNKLQVGGKYMKKLIQSLEREEELSKRKLQQLINMNIIQIIYKNASKDQKEDFQKYLTIDPYNTLNIFLQRINNLLYELDQSRKIHGLKIWNEVAAKNFLKSLDFKTNQFKRIEKIKCKSSIFIDELRLRNAYLESRGRKKVNRNPFDENKDFFSILNSFQFFSKKEKCFHRNLPTPQSFDVLTHQIPNLLPVSIMSFEDIEALELSYSFIAFFIDNTVVNQSEKFRCKSLARRVMTKFLQVKSLESRVPSEKFNQQQFFETLDSQNLPNDIEDWICEKKTERSDKCERLFEKEERKENEKKRDWKVDHTEASKYDYLPPKTTENIVFYSSENFYVLLRFLYTLYERVIRMKEVLNNPKKVIAFQLLFFACIRTKESIRFEDTLVILFGDSAYIYTTFYKLVESIYKSLNVVSTCLINNESIQVYHPSNEADYFYRLNKSILQTLSVPPGVKLVRCVFELSTKLVYINSISSTYASDQPNKELSKRRVEITQKIEYFTHMGLSYPEETNKTKPNNSQNIITMNNSEYCFEGNTIHMSNLPGGEDIMIQKKEVRDSLGEKIKGLKFIEKMN